MTPPEATLERRPDDRADGPWAGWLQGIGESLLVRAPVAAIDALLDTPDAAEALADVPAPLDTVIGIGQSSLRLFEALPSPDILDEALLRKAASACVALAA